MERESVRELPEPRRLGRIPTVARERFALADREATVAFALGFVNEVRREPGRFAHVPHHLACIQQPPAAPSRAGNW